MVDVSADEPAVPVCPVGPAIVSPAARASAALFGGLAVFQVGLAAGLPWGVAAWGGAHPGHLPTGFRLASAASAVVWAAIAVELAAPRLTRPEHQGHQGHRGHRGHRGRRRLLTVLTAVMVLAAVMNAASPSPVERAIWTPFALVQILLLWAARRREGTA